MFSPRHQTTFIQALGLVTIIMLSLFCSEACFAEVSFSYGQKEPEEFIELLKNTVGKVESEIWGDVVVSVGQDGLAKALEAKKNNVVATFISRGEYESTVIRYKRRDVSVLFFDPSPKDMHRLAVMILNSSVGASHKIGVLSSEGTANWFSKVNEVDIRIRRSDDPPNVLLKGDVTRYLFIVPADNDLVKGVSFSDLITTLLEKRTGIIGFSPYLKNTAANAYYDPSTYVTELAFALKYSSGGFKKYPSNPRFSINTRILSAIGVRYKGSQKGDLNEE